MLNKSHLGWAGGRTKAKGFVNNIAQNGFERCVHPYINLIILHALLMLNFTQLSLSVLKTNFQKDKKSAVVDRNTKEKKRQNKTKQNKQKTTTTIVHK